VFLTRLLQAVLIGILVSVIWPTRKGAPWVPSRRPAIRRMLAMAGLKRGELLVDLGSGDGRVLIAAARRDGVRGLGVEIDPLRVVWSRLMIRWRGLHGQVRIVRGNLFDLDLSEADVVTCYLLQKTNDRLSEKLERELQPGARIVSNTFTFAGFERIAHDEKRAISVYRKG
jgi:SAM-dependent methyltransferase